jgi:hypothetical protein
MLPTLEQFSITTPVFIRKIDNYNHWNIEKSNNNSEDRAKKMSEKIFTSLMSSLWKVARDEEFYGVIASLSANRHYKAQAMDFIWITQEDLEEANIEAQLKPEGKCLYVKNLHFNIQMDNFLAQKLCYVLFEKDREAKRCSKNNIKDILSHQQSKNCKAIDETALDCVCQASQNLLESVV